VRLRWVLAVVAPLIAVSLLFLLARNSNDQPNASSEPGLASATTGTALDGQQTYQEACFSYVDTVTIYEANGAVDFATEAVIFIVSVAAFPGSYEIERADPTVIQVLHVTGDEAVSRMCDDISRDAGDAGGVSPAVAGQIDIEAEFSSIVSVDSLVRLTATDLVFDDDYQRPQIDIEWTIVRYLG
jgi:hypothetical protein